MIAVFLLLVIASKAFSSIPCYKPPQEPEEDIHISESTELHYDEDREMYYVGKCLNQIDAPRKKAALETERTCVFDIQNDLSETVEKAAVSWQFRDKRGPILPLPGGRRRQNSICSVCVEPHDGTEKLLANADRRQCVAKPGTWPWRVHGHMEMIFSNNSRYIGSGTLIGKRHVLTAAHNLYDVPSGLTPQMVTFYPGQSYDKTPWAAKATKIIIHPNYCKAQTKKERQVFDIGLIVLDQDLGKKLGCFGVCALEELMDFPKTLNIAGYPGRPDNGRCMYTMEGELKGFSHQGQRIYYDIDTSPGQSGACVWVQAPSPETMAEDSQENYYWDDAEEYKTRPKPVHSKALPEVQKKDDSATNYYCIATHSHGNDWKSHGFEAQFNSGTAITPEKMEIIEEWLALDPEHASILTDTHEDLAPQGIIIKQKKSSTSINHDIIKPEDPINQNINDKAYNCEVLATQNRA